MEQVTTIGLDIAKRYFGFTGSIVLARSSAAARLRRDDVIGFFKALPPCLIGIDACATGLHWAGSYVTGP
ncbi:hypothetical protein [Rhizobium leguminosarum]|uniref:hypothetical protein n=1 Tax=Rhizobium leguminosarum TaxID=384 RepID=UPI001F44545E|nr:hypothetical protein [Rhizobium leguminosarum]UIJ82302.1 hypothetical protein LZK78_25780 [Rhizobium leguminosarum]